MHKSLIIFKMREPQREVILYYSAFSPLIAVWFLQQMPGRSNLRKERSAYTQCVDNV